MTFQPLVIPSFKVMSLADAIAALKGAARNELISRTSVNLGFETNTAADFTSDLNASYATATSIAGTLGYPNTLNLPSRNTTILAFNEGASPGTVTINVNGGAWSAVDQNVLYTKSSGQGSPFDLTLFQCPIGFNNLRSIQATFTKASSSSLKNTQQIYVLPGQWGAVANQYSANGGSNSLSVQANDLAFSMGTIGRGVADANVPTMSHGGTAGSTRIIETSSGYTSSAGQQSILSMNGTGTFTSNAGSVTVSSGGGGHSSPTSTTYHFDCFTQILRFIQP